MVRIDVTYDGELRCTATHGPSGTTLVTDAPADNEGKGASFSPTDLAATALGTCIATTMGIVARRRGVALEGATVSVEKHMLADPKRRIGRLVVDVVFPAAVSDDERTVLERAAEACPVHASLGEDVEIDLRFARA